MSDLIQKVMNTDLSVPSFLGSGGPTGFENVDNDCISIPFLRLAQVNTPQAQPGQDAIKGLSAGMYFNPSTGRIYGAEPKFIILGFFRSWNVWNGQPPAARFVKTLTADDFEQNYQSRVQQVKGSDGKTTLQDKEGNRYQDTRNFFVMSADHPEDGVLLYPMTSSGIPMSKKWLAKASAIRVKNASGALAPAPMWSRVWGFKVSFIKGDLGSYYQLSATDDLGWIEERLAPVAKSGFEEVMAYDKARVSATEDHSRDITPDTPFNGQF